MSFVQPDFLVLLILAFCGYWLIPSRRGQNVLLLVTSVVFYGWVHPWFVGLLAFSTVLDYALALWMTRDPDRRGVALGLSLAGNLGALGVFKYYDFFVGNVASVLTAMGVQANLGTLDLVLPVGISFYTFQTLSYTIDVYRGRVAARRDFLDYAVYVTFFPQLVAGPIERAERFLPQIEAPRGFHLDRVLSGLGLATWGAFKKVCIADVVAPYVDRLHMLETMSTPLMLAAVLGFGVQILADFSGYTDIARGVARMLGFELTINFDRPFLATSTPDFWRRWHISLGSWIGDYVYAPLARLGGAGPLQITVALLITFSLIGLWHGAAWTFVIQGVWFGIWMVLYTLLTPLIPAAIRTARGARPVAIAFHLVVVMLPAGLMFREVTLQRVWDHLFQNPFAFTPDEAVVAWVAAFVALVMASPMIASVWIEDHLMPRIRASPWSFAVQTSAIAVGAVLIALFHRDTTSDFIYFQF